MIRKAVIPAAGKGERLSPLTLAIPKEMIRIGSKPVIEHVIEVLRGGGIKDVMIITGWKKGAILDYIGSGERIGINAYYRVQDEQKGIGHAVYGAKSWVNNEDFAIIYGDNYFKPAEKMKDIIEFHQKMRAEATLVLFPVEDPRRFGVVRMDKDGRVLAVKEKPTLEEAMPFVVEGKNYYYNIAGLIITSPIIFDYIEKTPPGANNEIQMTDAIELMRRGGHKIYGYIFDGLRYDIGTFESIKEADEQEKKIG